MNELISRIASDLNIVRYTTETDDSFISRLCYSALGMWCLKSALAEDNELIGISKRAQTMNLEIIQGQFKSLYSCVAQYIDDPKNREQLSVKIRKLYEDVGYLLTDENNRNMLSPYGRRVSFSDKKDLYLGLNEDSSFEMNGLGVFVPSSGVACTIREFLARDELTANEYVKIKFDTCDFEGRDLDVSELSFFNPLLKSPPSQSWQRDIATEYSIARKTTYGPYYRVIRCEDGQLLFYNEDHNETGLYSEDFRRLYFALRSFYNNPQPIWITNVDANYVRLQLSAKLPQREYYLLLLTSWPVGNSFSTQNYLLRRELLPTVTKALTAIDVLVKEF